MPENKENVIQNLSFQFAIDIVLCYKNLEEQIKFFPLSKQLLKSGTSIGANVEEAIGGQSKKDFIAKMFIAHKESKETYYWLRLLHTTGYMQDGDFKKLSESCLSIIRIISKILLTSQSGE